MKKCEEELVEKILKEQSLIKCYQKAFIVTSIGNFCGFYVNDMDENYIFGMPQEETKKMLLDKHTAISWRIPKKAIIEIYFPDYSGIKELN